MRLVDADVLMTEIMDTMPSGSARGVFRAYIDDAPTAYDVEKVVEQLETEGVTDEYGTIVDLADAVEIVRKGGVE